MIQYKSLFRLTWKAVFSFLKNQTNSFNPQKYNQSQSQTHIRKKQGTKLLRTNKPAQNPSWEKHGKLL